jgi:hypothetical protein
LFDIALAPFCYWFVSFIYFKYTVIRGYNQS